MLSLVWPKLCLCGQQTPGFVPKIIWCPSDPHCLEGLMLKGVVVQGLVWKSYEAILLPPVAPLRGSKTTWLVICQGREGQGRGSEANDQQYERSRGLNRITSSDNGGKVSPWTRFLLSQFFPCWPPWAFHSSDLLHLAHCPCSAPVCLTAYHSCYLSYLLVLLGCWLIYIDNMFLITCFCLYYLFSREQHTPFSYTENNIIGTCQYVRVEWGG